MTSEDIKTSAEAAIGILTAIGIRLGLRRRRKPAPDKPAETQAARAKEIEAQSNLLSSQAEMLQILSVALSKLERRVEERDSKIEALSDELEREKSTRAREYRELLEQLEGTLGQAQDELRETLRAERDDLAAEVATLHKQLQDAGISPAPKPKRQRNEKGQFQ